MPYQLIYYDTETTGVRSDKDRIIEIAAYNPTTQKTFCELIHPQMPIPPEASAIHYITDEMVANSPSFATIGTQFFEFCGKDAVLVAHNNDAFDKPFLEAECKRNNLELPPWKYIDSLKWARKYRKDLPKHPLQFLREVYGIPANQAHRALDDVIVLHGVFSKMIDDLPVETVLELLSHTKPLSRMPFGKYQGKLITEVPRDYISWMRKNGVFDKPENQELLLLFQKHQLTS